MGIQVHGIPSIWEGQDSVLNNSVWICMWCLVNWEYERVVMFEKKERQKDMFEKLSEIRSQKT